MDMTATDHRPAALIERLTSLREQLLEVADGWRAWADGNDADRDASARNLLQYLALRGHDLREQQEPLVALGLSSLGRSEGHVQATVDAVLDALTALVQRPPAPSSGAPIGFAHSREVLTARTAALLGPTPKGRPTRIMVTMPSEAAGDPCWCSGCSWLAWTACGSTAPTTVHPSGARWSRTCGAPSSRRDAAARVAVDLPGPKLRTGPLPAGTPRQEGGLPATPGRGSPGAHARGGGCPPWG